MAKIVRKLFGEYPERVHVLSEYAEFDREGLAEVSDEAAEVFLGCPGYKIEEPKAEELPAKLPYDEVNRGESDSEERHEATETSETSEDSQSTDKVEEDSQPTEKVETSEEVPAPKKAVPLAKKSPGRK